MPLPAGLQRGQVRLERLLAQRIDRGQREAVVDVLDDARTGRGAAGGASAGRGSRSRCRGRAGWVGRARAAAGAQRRRARRQAVEAPAADCARFLSMRRQLEVGPAASPTSFATATIAAARALEELVDASLHRESARPPLRILEAAERCVGPLAHVLPRGARETRSLREARGAARCRAGQRLAEDAPYRGRRARS